MSNIIFGSYEELRALIENSKTPVVFIDADMHILKIMDFLMVHCERNPGVKMAHIMESRVNVEYYTMLKSMWWETPTLADHNSLIFDNGSILCYGTNIQDFSNMSFSMILLDKVEAPCTEYALLRAKDKLIVFRPKLS